MRRDAASMGELINLKRVRKQRSRAEAKREAEANRQVHGLTRLEKEQARRARDAADRLLDGHKLND
jgi:hypothetical protein